MAKLLTCPICKKEFMTVRPNKKYCSLSCKEAGRKLQLMAWEDNNKDYHKNYMAKLRSEKRKEMIT